MVRPAGSRVRELVRGAALGHLGWLLALSACCPETGPDRRESFRLELAAVEAVQNVDMSDVSVYTLYAQNCPDSVGCCNTGACAGVFVPAEPVFKPSRVCPEGSTNPACWETPSKVALHELTHAALGPSSQNHGPAFWAALEAARKVLESQGGDPQE